jgi:hypothetical protein
MSKIRDFEEFLNKKEQEEAQMEALIDAELASTTEDDEELMQELGILPDFDLKAALKSASGTKDKNKLFDRYNDHECDKAMQCLNNMADTAANIKESGILD